MYKQLIFLISLLLLPMSNAMAYIGPGISGGAFTVIVGLFVSLVLAAYAIFWFPFKRLYKRIKPKKA